MTHTSREVAASVFPVEVVAPDEIPDEIPVVLLEPVSLPAAGAARFAEVLPVEIQGAAADAREPACRAGSAWAAAQAEVHSEAG